MFPVSAACCENTNIFLEGSAYNHIFGISLGASFFPRVCVDDNYSEAAPRHLLFPAHKYLMSEKK